MNSAIVTGGTGFIGSWLVKKLISRKMQVTILTSNINYINNSIYAIVKYINYDNFEQIYNVLFNEKYDIFFHLGWGGVNGCDKNNISLQLSNINVSIEMAKLAKKLGCELFVVTGTVAEYVFNNTTIDFSLRQTPNDVYGAAKVAAHYFLEVITKQICQDMIWVVLPSTYGEGRKEDNIITYTITKLLRAEKPIYGNLEQMWDFVYVEDVVNALIEIAFNGKHNKTYGIGSLEHKKLKEYIFLIRDIINPELELGINEQKEYENHLASSCINIDDLINEIGYIPRIEFKEGITRTIEYYKEKIGLINE